MNPVHLLSPPPTTVSSIIPRVILPRDPVELTDIANASLSNNAESEPLPQDLFYEQLGNTSIGAN